jgi:Tfp pilus assembly protein PilV
LSHKLLKEESGYSLVEVIASIMLLSIVIIPMVGMFDMGLNAATRAGNYDTARALANSNLEKVLSLSYPGAKTTYPPVNGTPAGTAVPCDEGIYDCEVTTTYVNDSLSPNSASTTKMQVEVSVTWAWGDYTTTGLKAQ